MTTPLDEFREYLASRGQRLTRERELLVGVIFALDSPFTAESVLEAVARSQSQSRISRATAYRTLQLLADSGQIAIGSAAAGSVQYSHGHADEPIADPCRSTHSKLIAGTCPWCGRAIRNGKTVDDGPV